MKILAFGGSNSSQSINKKLAIYVASLFSDSNVEVLDLNDYEMPIYSMDLEANSGIPKLAKDFAQKIDQSDLLIVSLAEHNGGYSTAFKNIFDWVSRINNRVSFGNKNMLLMATSPGERGGKTVLDFAKNTLPYNGASILETFSLPNFYQNFDVENGSISNQIMREEITSKIERIMENN